MCTVYNLLNLNTSSNEKVDNVQFMGLLLARSIYKHCTCVITVGRTALVVPIPLNPMYYSQESRLSLCVGMCMAKVKSKSIL